MNKQIKERLKMNGKRHGKNILFKVTNKFTMFTLTDFIQHSPEGPHKHKNQVKY